MSLFVESLKCLDGKPQNTGFHNDRMNATRLEVYGRKDLLDLEKIIVVPDNIRSAIVKCRVVYEADVLNFNCSLYLVRRPKSLKMVYDDNIDYHYKFEDRTGLENLLRQRDIYDDILIIKQGLITDASSANVVFFDGTRYVTPASPLLKGTKRQQLLEKGIIHEEELKLKDLPRFKEVCLINAMLELGETKIEISKVIP